VRVYTLQATSLFPSRALPAHFRCAPHPYSALDSQNLRARSCALVSLALLVKPDQVSLGGHPFSRLQGTHPLQRAWEQEDADPLRLEFHLGSLEGDTTHLLEAIAGDPIGPELMEWLTCSAELIGQLYVAIASYRDNIWNW